MFGSTLCPHFCQVRAEIKSAVSIIYIKIHSRLQVCLIIMISSYHYFFRFISDDAPGRPKKRPRFDFSRLAESATEKDDEDVCHHDNKDGVAVVTSNLAYHFNAYR